MITKGSGSNKREEQDGWIGSIIPNGLIAQELYHAELEAIENKRESIQEIETELADLIEAAKVEDSEENNALYDALKKNEDDEPGNAFDNKLVKAELKKAKKGSKEYELLKKVETLIDKKSSLAKAIKSEEKELKDAVQERYANTLSDIDIEIESLMSEFEALKNELAVK